jgi:hypothetical protein
MRATIRRHLLFALTSVGLLLANIFTLRALVELSRGNSTASHHVLIPLVTLVLIFQSRAWIFADARPAPAGLAVVAAGVALAAFGWTIQGNAQDPDWLSVAVSRVAGGSTRALSAVVPCFHGADSDSPP